MIMLRFLRFVVAPIVTLLAFAPATFAQSLDYQLMKHAPRIIERLREKDCKNVGVLKFRVKKGDGPVSDRVGSLNMLLADRLEVALALANPHAPARQINLIRNASAVAANTPGASHLSEEGRARLFAQRYPLAWGDEQVSPDAFLTGVVLVDANLRRMTVGILVFDRRGGKPERAIDLFTATPDPATLGEIGESFHLRGLFDEGAVKLSQEQAAQKAVEQAADVKSSEARHPLDDPAAPVTLDVFYDGLPVAIQFEGGKARVPEPREGQKVSLTIGRNGAKDRLALVVKVNGENTLFRERVRDLDCRKWILEPNRNSLTIEGYQMSDHRREDFRVLSQAESESREIDYGVDAGQISITVFREKSNGGAAEPAPALPDLNADPEEPLPDDLAALSRGVFPAQPPRNPAALKAQLRDGARRGGSRGLIAEGEQSEHKIRTVEFQADPVPLMSATVTYYRP